VVGGSADGVEPALEASDMLFEEMQE